MKSFYHNASDVDPAVEFQEPKVLEYSESFDSRDPFEFNEKYVAVAKEILKDCKALDLRFRLDFVSSASLSAIYSMLQDIATTCREPTVGISDGSLEQVVSVEWIGVESETITTGDLGRNLQLWCKELDFRYIGPDWTPAGAI